VPGRNRQEKSERKILSQLSISRNGEKKGGKKKRGGGTGRTSPRGLEKGKKRKGKSASFEISQRKKGKSTNLPSFFLKRKIVATSFSRQGGEAE